MRERVSYTVTITAEDDKIHLGSGFLEAVSAVSVVQMLKLCNERNVTGDCDDEDAAPLPKKKKSAKGRGATGGQDVYGVACAKLAKGVPTHEVEAWLQAQGVPTAAAAAMVDKAVKEGLSRQARAEELNEGGAP